MYQAGLLEIYGATDCEQGRRPQRTLSGTSIHVGRPKAGKSRSFYIKILRVIGKRTVSQAAGRSGR